MNKETVIKVENLNKVYPIYNQKNDRMREAFSLTRRKYHKDFYALRGVNFKLSKGESLGIIGLNGSGKSTLLKILSGILTPTQGSVEVKGRVAALLELGAGFNPEMTGLENIYLNGTIMGYTKEEMKSRVPQILKFADIGEFVGQPVKMYSSGMFARLAFSVAINVEPNILLIDEALAVGDVFFRQKCYAKLDELKKKGTAIVLVSHSMNEVEQFCTKALLLSNGSSIYYGDSKNAVRKYYLLEQKEFEEATSTEILNSDNFLNLPDKISKDAQNNYVWPRFDCKGMKLKEENIINSGEANCIYVEICDEKGMPKYVFEQGEAAYFCYEFETAKDLENLEAGIVIYNQKNNIVHGKSSLQIGRQYIKKASIGDTVRVSHKVILDIALGEYTFEIGISKVCCENISYIDIISPEVAAKQIQRVCHCTNLGPFFVHLATTSHERMLQLQHHGIADLPNEIILDVIKSERQEKDG